MKRFIAVAAIAASAAFAEDKPATKPAMPTPPDELKVEKWFVGNWSCKGKRMPGPMGPGGDIATRLEMKMELAGFWLKVEVISTKGPMKGEVAEGIATWDAASKMHVRYEFTPGPGWIKFTTPGWDGDKLVFDGDAMMGGQKMQMRHTITKKGENEFASVFEGPGPDGKMATSEEGSCTRAAKK
jgi:hypothetical protein